MIVMLLFILENSNLFSDFSVPWFYAKYLPLGNYLAFFSIIF